jgi:hypothetical protein
LVVVVAAAAVVVVVMGVVVAVVYVSVRLWNETVCIYYVLHALYVSPRTFSLV